MNVFDLLTQDHQRVRDIFSQLINGDNHDRQARLEQFGRLKSELLAHAHAEERLFYPKLVDQPPIHDKIEDGINEHHQVEKLVSRIDRMPVDDGEWLRAVTDLRLDGWSWTAIRSTP